tara:strand:+ start:2517 stop:3716 length:1200 start_codon:yes stop_codon:yes gene_type:complete
MKHSRRNKTKSKKKKNRKTIRKRKKILASTIETRLEKSIKHRNVTIGVITAPWLSNTKDSHVTSYMASSYVKWLESAGALVVPLEFDLSKPKLLGFLRQLNGIVLIGGGIDNTKTHTLSQFLTYQDTLYFVLNYVIYQNNIGNHYPMWCTCMSFEMAAIFFAENIRLKKQEDFKKYLTSAGNIGQDVINWTRQRSKIKKVFTKSELKEMKKKPTIFQAHCYCIPVKSKLGKKLSEVAYITSTNTSTSSCGKKGVTYISSYELKKFPIYAVQYHPEKPPFEYVNDGKRVPKTNISITTSFKMARFFIGEAKKNPNIWIGGKNYFDFTINDYNVYNKAITKRIKHLQKDKISSKNVGDAGVYLFGSSLVPLEGDILNNPWKKIMEGESINIKDNIDNTDFP